MNFFYKIPLISCLLLTNSLIFGQSVSDADFYISPTGNDQNSGSIAQPFATLERARVAVQSYKGTTNSDILVYILGGQYEVHEKVIFGLQDTGSEQQTITYAAYPGETPVFSAGKAVPRWSKATQPIAGLPAIAQSKVVVAKIIGEFNTLFDDQGILPRARTRPFFSSEKSGRNKLVVPPSVFKAWSNPEELEIAIRPHHAWILNILPVTKMSEETKTLYTEIDATYPMRPLHFLPETPNCWIENAIEELDEPGEWVYNSKKGLLYLWPRDDSTVYVPQLQEMILVEGEVDFDGPVDLPVRHLNFDGITFKHGERYTIAEGDAGLQHDWDFLDKDNALVRFRGAESCSVKNSHFFHTGGGAIRFDLHAQQNRIEHNKIHDIGGAGILISGYGPGTKDVSLNNTIFNNHIHHVGQIYWHSPGVMLWQSGHNQVANNLIHHTNYTSLIVSGCMVDFFFKNGRELSKTIRWQDIDSKPEKKDRTELSIRPYLHTSYNVIEKNEIHHSMEKMGDGNAIYIRGSGADNLIRQNYIHHLVSPMIMQCAIRTDGGQMDTIIRENIIYKCTSQGMMLKLNTKFENNIIADIISPPRGYYLSLREGPITGATITNNIFYAPTAPEAFIHEFAPNNLEKTEDRRGRAIARAFDALTDRNLYYCASIPRLSKLFVNKQQALGSDKNSVSADPLFVDPENGDFTLLPNSPALKLGFKPIDRSVIGLIK